MGCRARARDNRGAAALSFPRSPARAAPALPHGARVGAPARDQNHLRAPERRGGWTEPLAGGGLRGASTSLSLGAARCYGAAAPNRAASCLESNSEGAGAAGGAVVRVVVGICAARIPRHPDLRRGGRKRGRFAQSLGLGTGTLAVPQARTDAFAGWFAGAAGAGAALGFAQSPVFSHRVSGNN